MNVKLLTEHYLEFLSLKEGCTGWSESTLVKCHIVGNLMSRLICFHEEMNKIVTWICIAFRTMDKKVEFALV